MSQNLDKKKSLSLSNTEIDELLGIISDCDSHLQDYELDEDSDYRETYDNCKKWEKTLTKLRNKK